MNNRPISGKSKKATQLLDKEQQYKDLNAALEERSACLINEAESVLRDQDTLFGDLSNSFNSKFEFTSQDSCSNSFNSKFSSQDGGTSSITDESRIVKPPKQQSKVQPLLKNNVKQRPSTGGETRKKIVSSKPSSANSKLSSTNSKPPSANSKPPRSKSATQKQEPSVFSLIDERATFANRINTLELEAADEIYIPVELNEDVLPDSANDMGTDATIRFLKAKLRVMQEELENVAVNCREKVSTIAHLEEVIKDKEESLNTLSKKNEQLQNLIDKHKNTQEDVRSKNSQLETELAGLKKEVNNLKRDKKQTSANKNTLEVRLNRALEEVEKHKLALTKSRESSVVSNDTDRRRMDQLQAENKKLEKQKSELIMAFKKQLKLIDILKRQKMHIEAAKLLEFSEEEFIRALDWGKS